MNNETKDILNNMTPSEQLEWLKNNQKKFRVTYLPQDGSLGKKTKTVKSINATMAPMRVGDLHTVISVEEVK